MRLTTGGVRELHWHKASEWAYMLYGRARITAVDQAGRNFADDVGVGDLWFFPAGIPHSIQGLENDGAEFILVFDDGNFSENETFSITDWFAHTPQDVLAKNFGVAEGEFSGIPAAERYIFQGTAPGPLDADRVAGPAGLVPTSFSYRLPAQRPAEVPGGKVWIADASNFPITTTTCALVEIEPGGLRELHWHPTIDEWQYYIGGTGRMTVFANSGRARTFDYRAGDVGYVPFAMGHYVENTGETPLRFLETFKHSRFADVSLNQWMALTPRALVQDHLHLGARVMGALRKEKWPVVR
jgi:oxalate decarboxylase